MSRHFHRLAAVAALPLLAAGALAALATTPAAASGSSSVPGLRSCAGARLVRPSGTVILSCADGNSEIKGTHWSSWGRSAAVGKTDFGVNLCQPTCVASRMRFFPGSTVRLEGAESTAQGLLFSRAVLTYKRNGKLQTYTAYPET